MTSAEFIAANANVSPNADIVERWEHRIVANGLHLRGREGADAYLGKYGKGLKAPKAVMLARIAEMKGFPLFAARFWEEAFALTPASTAAPVLGTASPKAAVREPVIKAGFGRRPQLPVFTEDERVEAMVLDEDYSMEEKMDGDNAMLDVRDGAVSGGNKKGLASHVPLAVADVARGLGSIQLDCENVDGIYYAFDAVSIGGVSIEHLGYELRRERLAAALASLDPSGALRILPFVTGIEAKRRMREALRARKAEGFILKRRNAAYEEGDRHGNQWKHQFLATNAFIVGERHAVRNSVQISVTRSDGTLRDMGYLTIPANRSLPSAGTVVEVEYLYAHLGEAGKLQRSVFKAVRTDSVPADCTEAKLKFKASGEE